MYQVVQINLFKIDDEINSTKKEMTDISHPPLCCKFFVKQSPIQDLMEGHGLFSTEGFGQGKVLDH